MGASFIVLGPMSDASSLHPPIFVFGALRSGTTLLRLILTHHPELQSPGEADFLFDHISRTEDGWQYDLESLTRDRIFRAKGIELPQGLQGQELAQAMVAAMAASAPGRLSLNIHRNAPKMAALFPQARIVHLLRDPRDVSRSSIGMGWAGNSYYGVDHWVGTEQGWEAATYPDDQVLEVRFETLMGNLEPELTRLCDFLGLTFAPEMLTYYKNSTYGPPDPGIAQKWRSKAGPREIALIEGKVGGLLEKRGYAAAGEPAVPGGIEKLQLSAQNRLNRWRHNIRRYGAGLFLGHHLAKLLGLKSLARRLADRQEAIRIENLQ